MDTTNLPTDSIYKFIGLSGLFLLVLSLTFPFQQMRNIEEELFKVDKEISILKKEKEFFNYKNSIQLKLDSISKRTNQILNTSLFNKTTSTDSTAIFIEKFKSDFESFNKNYQPYLKNLEEEKLMDIKRIDIEYSIQRTEYLNNEFLRWLLICIIGMLVGSILFLYGFFLWYTRSQIYIDYNLKKEALDRGFKYKEKGNNYIRIIKVIGGLLCLVPLIIILTYKITIWLKIIFSLIIVVLILNIFYLKKKN